MFEREQYEHRHISHLGAQEFIRKIATVDHVNLIDADGHLISMLEYIFPASGARVFLGLGSRHTSAAALSEACDAVVFTVQGSIGAIHATRDRDYSHLNGYL
jgi:DNA integrity scanning protein DisA with diadenylate cyclase activity